MAINWISKRNKVYDKLLVKGHLFEFTRRGTGNIDPIESKIENRIDSVFKVPGIIHMQSSNAIRWGDAPPILVEQGDELLMLGAKNYEPQLEDQVTIGGEQWTVKSIVPFRPATIVIFYWVAIGKG